MRTLQKRVAQLEKRSCDNGVGERIAAAFGGRPLGGTAGGERTPDPKPRDVPRSEADQEQPAEPATEPSTSRQQDAEQRRKGFEVAKTGLAARRAQALAALDEQVAPTPAQKEAIEQAFADMNTDLMTLATDFVAEVKLHGDADRHTALVFAANTLDVVLTADDAIYNTLTPEQLEGLDDTVIDPMSFIEPELIDVFIELDAQ